MLTGARFRNDALFAHFLCKEALAQSIIDLVGPRMVQVFPFEIDFATMYFGKMPGRIQGRWSAHIVAEQLIVLFLERFTFENIQLAVLEFRYTPIKDLRDIGTAKLAIKSRFVHQIVVHIFIV